MKTGVFGHLYDGHFFIKNWADKMRNSNDHYRVASRRLASRAFILFAMLASTTCIAEGLPPPTTLHLVGDSTMSNKENLNYPERGWGQILPGFMLPQLRIMNHAANGRSTKRFVDEGRWAYLLSELSAGDYVLVQFGHNDQKKDSPSRYADAENDYPEYLTGFINDVTERGAHIMIASSICRRHFDNEGKLKRTLTRYASAAEQVARKHKVTFIPMNTLTCDFFASIGDGASEDYFIKVPAGIYAKFPNGKVDNTHVNVVGATKVSQLFVRALKAQNHPLADYVYRTLL